MEFFGLTSYGFSSPIEDMLKDGYKEPMTPPANYLENEKDRRSFSEKIKELDCYVGCANGYAYGSCDRLTRMRRKYLFKPVGMSEVKKIQPLVNERKMYIEDHGPTEMYKYCGTNAMNCGWWTDDPVLNNLTPEENWFKPRVTHSITTSAMSRFVQYCLKIDKYFKM